MTVDPGLATIVVAGIAAAGTIVNTFITRRQNHKINETHKQVTVNHHSSDFPTVLDRIDDVQQAVLGLATELVDMRSDFTKHVTHSNEMDLRLVKLEVTKETEREIRLHRVESEAASD